MSSTRKTPEYPSPTYNLPTGEAAEAAEAAAAATEAAGELAGWGGELAGLGAEAVEAAATGAGGAAFGSGAFGDIARSPWPGLTRLGFVFVTGCTGQPILGSIGMMRIVEAHLLPHAEELDGIPNGAATGRDCRRFHNLFDAE